MRKILEPLGMSHIYFISDSHREEGIDWAIKTLRRLRKNNSKKAIAQVLAWGYDNLFALEVMHRMKNESKIGR